LRWWYSYCNNIGKRAESDSLETLWVEFHIAKFSANSFININKHLGKNFRNPLGDTLCTNKDFEVRGVID